MSTRLADATIIVVSVAAGLAVPFLLSSIGDRFTTGLVVISAAAAAIGMNHSIPRRPKLRVEYRNPGADNRPVAWLGASQRPCSLVVVVINEGLGIAEAFEVEFDSPGGMLYNPSGNSPNPRYLDRTMHPPRFISGERVLEPKQELPIAMWNPAKPGIVSWRATAKHMKEQQGSIEILEIEPPTSQ